MIYAMKTQKKLHVSSKFGIFEIFTTFFQVISVIWLLPDRAKDCVFKKIKNVK